MEPRSIHPFNLDIFLLRTHPHVTFLHFTFFCVKFINDREESPVESCVEDTIQLESCVEEVTMRERSGK